MKTSGKQKLLLAAAVMLTVTALAFKNVKSAKKVAIKPVAAIPIAKPAVKRADFNFKNIEFDFNKANVRPSSYAELDRIAAKLQETKAALKVSGHADSKGTYLYNWKLSQARAESVKNYLIKKGYDDSKIAATEFGDTKPIASNSTPTGRQKNRRVELEAY